VDLSRFRSSDSIIFIIGLKAGQREAGHGVTLRIKWHRGRIISNLTLRRTKCLISNRFIGENRRKVHQVVWRRLLNRLGVHIFPSSLRTPKLRHFLGISTVETRLNVHFPQFCDPPSIRHSIRSPGQSRKAGNSGRFPEERDFIRKRSLLRFRLFHRPCLSSARGPAGKRSGAPFPFR
jgi:hypothetical protein